MSLEITGKLLLKYETQQVSEKFKKREFVLELAEEINGNLYTNYAKMQLVQTKCEIIDRFNPGDIVKVSFNIKGTRYEKDGKVNYFSNLDAWRVESANAQPAGGGQPIANQQSYGNQQQAPAYNSGNNYAGNQGNGGFSQGGNMSNGAEPVDDLPF
jgi:hypothetical protein